MGYIVEFLEVSVLRAISAGVCILGVVMTTIGVFSLSILDFFGLSEPLAELTGRKYVEKNMYSLL